MSVNHLSSLLLLTSLLTCPGLSFAQSSSTPTPAFFIGQRAWYASWDLPIADTRIITVGDPATPLVQEDLTNVEMRKIIPVTTLGVRFGAWSISTSLTPWTTFTDDRLATGQARRQEYDLNFGYAVSPNVGIVAIYKGGRANNGVARGSAYVDQSIVWEKQRLRGILVGLSGNAAIGESTSMYGNLAYGPGKTTLSADGLTESFKYKFRYTVGELGFSYRIPSISFGNLALQAGYRFQMLTYTNVEYDTLDPTTGTILSTRNVRSQSTTHGPAIGVSLVF